MSRRICPGSSPHLASALLPLCTCIVAGTRLRDVVLAVPCSVLHVTLHMHVASVLLGGPGHASKHVPAARQQCLHPHASRMVHGIHSCLNHYLVQV